MENGVTEELDSNSNGMAENPGRPNFLVSRKEIHYLENVLSVIPILLNRWAMMPKLFKRLLKLLMNFPKKSKMILNS